MLRILKIFEISTKKSELQGSKYGAQLNSLDNIYDLTY
jgi:hypothetical protein